MLDIHSEAKLAVKSVISLAFVHHTALIVAAEAVCGVIANTPSSIAIISRTPISRFLDFVIIEISSFFVNPLAPKDKGIIFNSYVSFADVFLAYQE